MKLPRLPISLFEITLVLTIVAILAYVVMEFIDPQTCPQCDGLGHVQRVYFENGEGHAEQIPCPRCRGGKN